MSTASNRFKPQIRFVELLDALTKAGRAEWLQSKKDPGFVYCLLDGEDLVVFECMGGKKGDEYVAPNQEVAGVVAHHSNTTYLWLPSLPSWNEIAKLLRESRADRERWRLCKRIAHEAPVRALERRLTR